MNGIKQKKISDFLKRERKNWVNYVRRWIDGNWGKDAEDIVQDVMLNVFDSADITRPIENLSAYIYRSLKNSVVDQFRKKKTIFPIEEEKELSLKDLIVEKKYDSHSRLEKQEELERLYKAIDKLDSKDRAIIIATELDGISFKELSLKWDEPLGTLLARKSRALKKIRKFLEISQ